MLLELSAPHLPPALAVHPRLLCSHWCGSHLSIDPYSTLDTFSLCCSLKSFIKRPVLDMSLAQGSWTRTWEQSIFKVQITWEMSFLTSLLGMRDHRCWFKLRFKLITQGWEQWDSEACGLGRQVSAHAGLFPLGFIHLVNCWPRVVCSHFRICHGNILTGSDFRGSFFWHSTVFCRNIFFKRSLFTPVSCRSVSYRSYQMRKWFWKRIFLRCQFSWRWKSLSYRAIYEAPHSRERRSLCKHQTLEWLLFWILDSFCLGFNVDHTGETSMKENFLSGMWARCRTFRISNCGICIF